MKADVGIASVLSPAIVRFANTIWIFGIDFGGKLAFTHAAPAWNCAANNIDACPLAQFAPVETPPDVGAIDALDAKTLTINGKETVVLIGIRPGGSVFEMTLAMEGGVPMLSAPAVLTGSLAKGEPSLANNFAKSSLALAYKGQDDKVILRFRSVQGWGEEIQPQVNGRSIAMSAKSSPALVYAALPLGLTAGEHLIGAFTDPQAKLHLYTPQQLPGHTNWGRIAVPYEPMTGVIGRPVMAWTGGAGVGAVVGEPAPAAASSTTYGRLYIVFTQYGAPAAGSPDPENPMIMAMSYVDPSGILRIGLVSYYDNQWAFAYGLSLLTPSDGGALRAAFTSAVRPPETNRPEKRIFLRPHADGIVDRVYQNRDDWKALAYFTCKVLVAHQAASPVVCADPW